jgi:RNA polymerase sigma-70 factor (ECF subfamily)
MPPEFTEEGSWFAENLFPHEPMLRAWLKARFGSGIAIDDVIQEAYLRILRARQTDPVKAPKAFLFATARNLALNAVRSAKVRNEHVEQASLEDEDLLDGQPDARESFIRHENLEILTRAIQSLPDRCRQIFTLRKVYGLSQAEIAEKLNLSPRTVNAQISIGVNKCAEFVGRIRQGEIA